MNRTIRALGSGPSSTYVESPNLCPHCHIAISPSIEWFAVRRKNLDIPRVYSAWNCTNDHCSKLILTENLYDENSGAFHFSRYLNGFPQGPTWPDPILNLKAGGTQDPSKFIKTYLQSLEAENSGLDEIAGMGYRKAIEYLVKDWAIQTVPADQSKIESLWLGQIISQYFTGDLKEILERATWLGNDQAHYNKLFDDFDLNDLKELIALIMVELDRQHKLNHYINTIQKRK